ncbi:PEP-CTERM domain protein [Oscillatoriales cyanobacterium USR001]|nr:PEP-CTERM domain protein [Oscillatoriales cyanobacterium USR001]
MKFTRKASLTAALLIAAVTVGKTSPAEAFSFYFGEDLSSNENVRLTASPNADAARDRFLSRLIGVGTETFESYNRYTQAPLSISFGAAGTATIGGDGYIERRISGTNTGRYPISGQKYWEAWEEFTIDFSNPIAAFGFYGTDIGDINGNLTLTLLNSLTGFSQQVTVNHTAGRPANVGGSVLYFGLIADPNQAFNKIIFGNSSGGDDAFAFDNMTIGGLEQIIPNEPSPAGGNDGGTPSEDVPEPLTMAGMALGGVMLAGARKLRQGKQKATVEKA